MQKKFLVGLLISIFGLINAAEMTIDVSEKIDISSDNIEIKNEEIGFKDNVIFRSKSYKIFGDLGFDLNTFENQTCKLFFVHSNSIYFFEEDNLGYFVLPQSLSSYFHELINSLSNSKNLSYNTEIELDNYFNFLIKSDP